MIYQDISHQGDESLPSFTTADIITGGQDNSQLLDPSYIRENDNSYLLNLKHFLGEKSVIEIRKRNDLGDCKSRPPLEQKMKQTQHKEISSFNYEDKENYSSNIPHNQILAVKNFHLNLHKQIDTYNTEQSCYQTLTQKDQCEKDSSSENDIMWLVNRIKNINLQIEEVQLILKQKLDKLSNTNKSTNHQQQYVSSLSSNSQHVTLKKLQASASYLLSKHQSVENQFAQLISERKSEYLSKINNPCEFSIKHPQPTSTDIKSSSPFHKNNNNYLSFSHKQLNFNTLLSPQQIEQDNYSSSVKPTYTSKQKESQTCSLQKQKQPSVSAKSQAINILSVKQIAENLANNQFKSVIQNKNMHYSSSYRYNSKANINKDKSLQRQWSSNSIENKQLNKKQGRSISYQEKHALQKNHSSVLSQQLKESKK